MYCAICKNRIKRKNYYYTVEKSVYVCERCFQNIVGLKRYEKNTGR